MLRYGMDDPSGPLLATSEEVEETSERAEEDHADCSGHQYQDRSGRRGMAVEPRWDAKPVGDEESDQRAPEHDVQHDGRADALGA